MDELIELLKKRNATAAYPALHRQFFRLVRKHVIENKGSDDDAAIVFNDAYMIVEKWVAEGRYEEQGSFKSWFMDIVRCQWINHLRKRPKWFLLPDMLDILPDRADETPAEVWEIAERQEKEYEVYRKCRDSLGSPCRELLIKICVEEKSIREVALEMGYYDPDKQVFDKDKNRVLTEDEKLHNADRVVIATKSRCKTRLEACVQPHLKEE